MELWEAFLLNYSMKNNLVYLLIGVLFPTTILFSQSEWIYKKTISIEEEIESISIQGDTVIQGRLCLTFAEPLENEFYDSITHYFVNEVEGSFVYSALTEQFYQIHDYSISIGDTLKVDLMKNEVVEDIGLTAKFIVEDIDGMPIGNHYFIKQKIRPLNHEISFGSEIIFAIGSNEYFLPSCKINPTKYSLCEMTLSQGQVVDINSENCENNNPSIEIESWEYRYLTLGGESGQFSINVENVENVQGENCLKLSSSINSDFHYGISHFLFKGERGFVYSQETEKFYEIFDSGLKAGEFMRVELMPNEIGDSLAFFQIESIEEHNHNGNELIKQKILPLDPVYSFGQEIIEGIGSDGYFLPSNSLVEVSTWLCRVTTTTGGVLNISDTPCPIVNSSYSIPESQLSIFPNPVINQLQIVKDRDNSNRKHWLEIFDNIGTKIVANELDLPYLLDMSTYQSGMYNRVVEA